MHDLLQIRAEVENLEEMLQRMTPEFGYSQDEIKEIAFVMTNPALNVASRPSSSSANDFFEVPR